MRAIPVLLLAACGSLAACAFPGDALMVPLRDPVAGVGDFFPPSRITVVEDATPGRVTYEFDRVRTNDFAYANRAAESFCAPAGKRAHLVSLGMRSPERGLATFTCL